MDVEVLDLPVHSVDLSIGNNVGVTINFVGDSEPG